MSSFICALEEEQWLPLKLLVMSREYSYGNLQSHLDRLKHSQEGPRVPDHTHQSISAMGVQENRRFPHVFTDELLRYELPQTSIYQEQELGRLGPDAFGPLPLNALLRPVDFS